MIAFFGFDLGTISGLFASPWENTFNHSTMFLMLVHVALRPCLLWETTRMAWWRLHTEATNFSLWAGEMSQENVAHSWLLFLASSELCKLCTICCSTMPWWSLQANDHCNQTIPTIMQRPNKQKAINASRPQSWGLCGHRQAKAIDKLMSATTQGT